MSNTPTAQQIAEQTTDRIVSCECWWWQEGTPPEGRTFAGDVLKIVTEALAKATAAKDAEIERLAKAFDEQIELSVGTLAVLEGDAEGLCEPKCPTWAAAKARMHELAALTQKLQLLEPELDYYKRQFDGALANLTPAYAERDKVLFELRAAQEAFKPVEDWYNGDNEDGLPLRTFPQMIADAVADLQHDRKESNEYRKQHPEAYCQHGVLKGHCPECL